jgi:hypothetical protein
VKSFTGKTIFAISANKRKENTEGAIKEKLATKGKFVVTVFAIFRYSFMTYHRVCNKNNMTNAACDAGTAYPSGKPEFTPGF